jgi:hypothetical protein
MAGQWRNEALGQMSKFNHIEIKTDAWSPKRPSPSVWECAKNLILDFPDDFLPTPFVMATIDGGIELEWHADERELDIGILSNGKMEYLKLENRNRLRKMPLT